MPNFHICKVINYRAHDLQCPTGHVQHASVADIQLLMPAEYLVSMVPDINVFRWGFKYINHLKWQSKNVGIVQMVDKNVNIMNGPPDLGSLQSCCPLFTSYIHKI